MVQTPEQKLKIHLTNDARLIQVYDDGKYSTVVDGDLLYLLSSTKIHPSNTIATIDATLNCVIYDRDKANCFVDYSHEHFRNAAPIDYLPESKIQNYITNYLCEDIMWLLQFKPCDTNKELDTVINKFPENLQKKIQKSLVELGVTGVPYIRAYNAFQMTELYEKKYYYACFNLESMRYELTNNGDFSKTFKNGSCGSWNQLTNIGRDKGYVFFFDKLDIEPIVSEGLLEQIDFDVKNSPYKAANKFLILEDKFTKAMDIAVKQIIEKQGFCDTSSAYYSSIEPYTESIAKAIRKYQNSNDTKLKAQCKSDLLNYYSNSYKELQKMQDKLKELHNLKEKLYGTTKLN